MKKALTLEEQRREWKRADEERAEAVVAQAIADGITPEQCAARLALDYKPETKAEQRERESMERSGEVAAMRTDHVLERRRIASEEYGESYAELLSRVIELQLQRDCAIKLAAKYKSLATALIDRAAEWHRKQRGL